MRLRRLVRDCRGGAKFGSLGTVPYLSDPKSAGGLRSDISIVYAADPDVDYAAAGIVMQQYLSQRRCPYDFPERA